MRRKVSNLFSKKTFLRNCAKWTIAAGMLTVSSFAHAVEFSEAPMLKIMVEENELPAVGDRLPETPMIVQPTNMLGKYGGTWRMGVRRGRDHALLIRTMGYENLLRWNPEWTGVIPNIAKSYTVNEDATEYVFYFLCSLFSSFKCYADVNHLTVSPGL